MTKIKILFYGSDKYSNIVLQALKKDKRFLMVKDIQEKPDVSVLASYSRILLADELKAIPHGILNLHPSLLPKYRGPSPVQTAILNGEKQTGVTIIKMDEKIDHGPIVAQSKEIILPADTAETLYQRLFTTGAETLMTILPEYLEGKIELQAQDHSQATYSKKFSREDGQINWQKPAKHLDRFIRAMFPWPGAWTEIRDTRDERRDMKNATQTTSRVSRTAYHPKRLKILKAHLEEKSPQAPRLPSSVSPITYLVLDIVQLEGKKPVTFKQFCEGYPQTKIIGYSF